MLQLSQPDITRSSFSCKGLACKTSKDYVYQDVTSNLRDHLVHCYSKEFQSAIVVNNQLLNQLLNGLVNQLTSVEDDSSANSEFKCTVVSALKRKWSLQEKNVKQLSVLSTALDPRFKYLKFLNDNQRVSVEGEVVGMATR